MLDRARAVIELHDADDIDFSLEYAGPYGFGLLLGMVLGAVDYSHRCDDYCCCSDYYFSYF
ncbi:MAG: hypothetical protein ACTJLM_03320 [Ehrlichia sp.]